MKVQRVPIYSLTLYTCGHPTINILSQNGTFVTIDEPALKHRYHSKLIVYISVHFWFCTFYEFGKICIHHYSFIQNSLMALKILYALPIHFSLPRHP